MNQIVRLLVSLFALFVIAGCSTPVAVDPATGDMQTAVYQAGTFTGSVAGEPNAVFRKAIVAIDNMGLFRTGELHKNDSITIYARATLDKKITVRISQNLEEVGYSDIRIRVGQFGDLAQSQRIFSAIRSSL